MQKNYRKTPLKTKEKIKELNCDTIEVCAILNIKVNDLANPKYRHLGLRLETDEVKFKSEFIPSKENGRYSKKNINGYKVKYPKKPKISKSIYCGERSPYGDSNKGSFSLFSNRLVIPYDIYPPKELTIKVTNLKEENKSNDNNTIVLKVAINMVLDRTDKEFDSDLLFAINLLQENVFEFNIFPTNSSKEDFLKTQFLNWDIFPPGTRESDLSKIINPNKNYDEKHITSIEERYDFLKSKGPTEIINGKSGMRHYFGAKFSDNFVVFENTDYGNAIYVLFENWITLSKLSRTEIQNRHENDYVRIPHSNNWKQSLSTLIKEKLSN